MAIPMHRIAVACLVVNAEDKILLVRNENRGWEFPGGYVDRGESLQSAAVREVMEESGIQIEITKFCGIDQKIDKATFVFLFAGNVVGGELQPSYETKEVGFFSKAEAEELITYDLYQNRIDRCLRENEFPKITEW